MRELMQVACADTDNKLDIQLINVPHVKWLHIN